jgi:hypothetical protein
MRTKSHRVKREIALEQLRLGFGFLVAIVMGALAGNFLNSAGYAFGALWLICIFVVPTTACLIANRWYLAVALIALGSMHVSLLYGLGK